MNTSKSSRARAAVKESKLCQRSGCPALSWERSHRGFRPCRKESLFAFAFVRATNPHGFAARAGVINRGSTK